MAQEQYPTPLIHTATNHPAARVVLLSVDGLHALDLERWVKANPSSAFAELSARGVTYSQARLTVNDEAAGMLALATGGTAISTRIPGARFMDRAPASGNAACGRIDLRADPPKCGHLSELVGVNNIFELVHADGGQTAWAGDGDGLLALYRGRSGSGLSVEASPPKNMTARAADAFRAEALQEWVTAESAHVPRLMGMNFSAFAASQRNGGYNGVLGTMSSAQAQVLREIDVSVGKLIAALKSRSLFETTWIIVTATYTASPVDAPAARWISIRDLIQAGGPDVTELDADGVASIWLWNRARAPSVAERYAHLRDRLGIAEIETLDRLQLALGPAGVRDSRSPDLILVPSTGVIWGEKSARRADMSANVALLVSGAQLTGRTDPTPIPTTQTAAMLLRALGMEKLTLEALHREHSPALPGIF